MTHLLEVENLETTFKINGEEKKIIEEISFHVDPGEVFCIVGESGSGKTVTMLSIMGLLGKNATITQGEVRFDGEILNQLSEKKLDTLRGKEISVIFQDALSSLNPSFTIQNQLLESILHHMSLSKKEALLKAKYLLEKVGFPDAEVVLKKYPHMLSGGQRQRVMIAIALACNPKVLIADEPTTALDVSIQAQIIQLLKDLQQEFGMAILLITHNMGLVAQMADHVMVMFKGQIVEKADVFQIFDAPQHPYTQALLQSIPDIKYGREQQLTTIVYGESESNQSLIEVSPGHLVRRGNSKGL